MTTSTERTRRILQKADAQRKKNKKIKLISIITSVVAAVIITFNLVLFVPYTVGGVDLTKYSSSEYYNIIRKLYGLTYSPRQTNNYQEWIGSRLKDRSENDRDIVTSAPPPTSAPSDPGSYRETTLNQTDGVIEGDLFKRSDTHIYYLGFTYGDYSYYGYDSSDGSVQTIVNREPTLNLRVYDIAGENSHKVAEYTIEPDKGVGFSRYKMPREMFLSEDLSTVTVIAQCFLYETNTSFTVTIDIDVSDLTDIKERARTYVSGEYDSSRVVNGELLISAIMRVSQHVDFDNKLLYVPHYGKLGELKPLPTKDIICPNDVSAARYTVIYTLDGEREVTDSVALLSFSSDIYVSQNNIFVTRTSDTTVDTQNEYQLRYSYNSTEIRVIKYGNGVFGEPRSITAAGSIRDRYSLDEYDGVLRVFTTIRPHSASYNYTGNDPYKGMFYERCALYCFDLDTLEQKAKVVDFAPDGESVQSARFYGNTAYVCTAKVLINPVDPVFVFDLTDLDDIAYTDTGTIPGYSLSLNDFAFDTLLGIGYGDDIRMLKIELYKQTYNAVESVAKYEEPSVIFSTDYKAHLIDAENGIIGLGICSSKYDQNYRRITRYAIFRYDGETLDEIASVDMRSDLADYMRAVVVDGYLYVIEDDGDCTASDIKVVKIA